jgi:hypothetical protein
MNTSPDIARDPGPRDPHLATRPVLGGAPGLGAGPPVAAISVLVAAMLARFARPIV